MSPPPKPCTVWLPPLCWLQGLEPEQKPRGDKKVSGQDSKNPGSFLLLTPRKPIGRPPDSGIISHSGEVQRTRLWRNWSPPRKQWHLRLPWKHPLVTYCSYSKDRQPRDHSPVSFSEMRSQTFSVGELFFPSFSVCTHSFLSDGFAAATSCPAVHPFYSLVFEWQFGALA